MTASHGIVDQQQSALPPPKHSQRQHCVAFHQVYRLATSSMHTLNSSSMVAIVARLVQTIYTRNSVCCRWFVRRGNGRVYGSVGWFRPVARGFNAA